MSAKSLLIGIATTGTLVTILACLQRKRAGALDRKRNAEGAKRLGAFLVHRSAQKADHWLASATAALSPSSWEGSGFDQSTPVRQ
jgi:hypothetical protein